MPLCENHGPYTGACQVCEEFQAEKRSKAARSPTASGALPPRLFYDAGRTAYVFYMAPGDLLCGTFVRHLDDLEKAYTALMFKDATAMDDGGHILVGPVQLLVPLTYDQWLCCAEDKLEAGEKYEMEALLPTTTHKKTFAFLRDDGTEL